MLGIYTIVLENCGGIGTIFIKTQELHYIAPDLNMSFDHFKK